MKLKVKLNSWEAVVKEVDRLASCVRGVFAATYFLFVVGDVSRKASDSLLKKWWRPGFDTAVYSLWTRAPVNTNSFHATRCKCHRATKVWWRWPFWPALSPLVDSFIISELVSLQFTVYSLYSRNNSWGLNVTTLQEGWGEKPLWCSKGLWEGTVGEPLAVHFHDVKVH